MMQFKRIPLPMAALAGMLAAAALVAAAAQPAGPTAYRADWLQQSSDLKADPAITFGKLPNGMRYALQQNNTPADSVSMRLRIDVGSVQESAAQQGIAHLLEHMAFRGSKQIADGEVVKTLERLGLRFGADTNASTGFNETTYMFDLPKSDAGSVTSALTLLREITTELNLSAQTLATERGVVLSELRLRNTPEERASEAELLALLPDQPLPKRFPGGKPEIIANASPRLVRSFYEAWYQPQRATLVIVGNIDIAAVEKQIQQQFGNWKQSRAAANDPDLGSPKPAPTVSRAYFEDSLPTVVSASWARPYDPAPPTVASSAADTIEDLGFSIVNERLSKLALAADAPYTRAGADSSDLGRSARITSLSVNSTAEKWQGALSAARGVLNSTLAEGVPQADVDRRVRDLLNRNQVAAQQAGTRSTPALARVITGSLGRNQVVVAPQYNADIDAAAVAGLKAETVTAALRKAFGGDSALVFMQSDKPLPGADARLAAAWQTSQGSRATPAQIASDADPVWPYTNFGAPGQVVARIESPEQQATFVRFANGVLVGVRSTKFQAGNVQVVFKLNGGLFALPKDAPVSSMFAPGLATGGLQQLDIIAIRKALTGKTASVSTQAGDTELQLRGSTTPADLATQLQYLTAYLTAPGFNAGAFEQAKNGIAQALPSVQAQPIGNLGLKLNGFLHDNDARWEIPSVDAVMATRLESLRGWLEPMLKQGALQVSIVGDVAVDKAIELAAATVGAIAARPAPVLTVLPTGALNFPKATPTPVALTHSGSKDQSAVAVAWPAPVWRGSSDVPTLRVLSALMQERLLQAVRSDNGTSYTASVGIAGSVNVPDYGFVAAMSVVKPDQVKKLMSTIAGITSDLRNKPISADELQRAVNPLVSANERSLQNNGYLAGNLVSPELERQSMEQYTQMSARLQAVTAAQVQAAAAKYLLDEKAWKAVMSPQ